jgi:hypothetical protein
VVLGSVALFGQRTLLSAPLGYESGSLSLSRSGRRISVRSLSLCETAVRRDEACDQKVEALAK